MQRPPESLKSLANRIARTAASDDAAQMVRLLQLSGLIGEENDDAVKALVSNASSSMYVAEPGVPPRESKHIGIWERRVEDGKTCFVRRLEMSNAWHYWANISRIEPKGSKRRIVFMGESVARGYLYDPDFTPALALQMILDDQFGKGEVEVLDLARTSLDYKVRELALAALQLEPDMAIIFAGNNWDVSAPLFSNIAELDQVLANEGMSGLKRISEEYIDRMGRRVVSDVASEYKNSDVPLVWIIPENNLGEWRDPVTNAPYLPGDLNREWLNLYEEAHSALSNGDPATAEKLGQKMITIDEGVCVGGLYILADCRRLVNDVEGERKYLELARDAQCWDSSIVYMPKPYSVTQKMMREEMARHGQQVVDLPALFKEYLNGGIPDRRLFLDYCHLTTEGIRVTMGAAASCVLRSLKEVEVSWYALVNDQIAPPPKIEAEASFLAAIHDAHWWQSYDMVHHFCARALSYSPHVAELMLNYIDLQNQKAVPLRMSEAEKQIIHLGSPLIHRYLFRTNNKRLDKLLMRAMVHALEDVGIEAEERLKRLRREEHSVKLREIDLLSYYYHSASEQAQEVEALTWDSYRLPYDIRYFRAYWPESRFVFVGEAGCAVNLCLTCRLPKPGRGEGQITITLNGEPQGEMTISTEWSTWDITLPGEAVLDDLNEITVRWPMPEFQSAEALSKVTMKLCQLKFPDFFPVFGEIHSFTASNSLKSQESQLDEVSITAAGIDRVQQ